VRLLLISFSCSGSLKSSLLFFLCDVLLGSIGEIFDKEVHTSFFLFTILDGVLLVDTRTEVGGITSEGNINALKEGVCTLDERLRSVSSTFNTRLTVINDHTIGKVCGHDEIVLDNECSTLAVKDETLDNLGGDDTLLRIEVSRRLIKQVDISGKTKAEDDSDTLQLTTRKLLHALIEATLDLEGLDNISIELRVDQHGADLLLKKLTNSTSVLGADLLRLVADVELRKRLVRNDLTVLVDLVLVLDLGSGDLCTLLAVSHGLQETCEHTDEGGLTGTVLTEQDDDLTVVETTGLNVKCEGAEGDVHVRVVVDVVLLGEEKVIIHGGISHVELQTVLTETKVLSGHETIKEDVDTLTDTSRSGNNTISTRLTVEHADVIGHVIEHRKIVLDDDDVLVSTNHGTDDFCSLETLLDIEVGARLIEHVDISLLDAGHGDGETLQLTTGKLGDVTGEDAAEVELTDEPLSVVAGILLLEELADCTTDSTRDVIDVLGLDDGLEVILNDAEEVALKLRATEVGDDLLPVGRAVITTQIGLQLAREDVKSSTLTDTVLTDKTEHLTRARDGETVELESVGTITVGGLTVKSLRKIDDGDSLIGTSLHTNTATNAQVFAEPCDLISGLDGDTLLAHTHNRAPSLALKLALLGLALIGTHDSDTCLGIVSLLVGGGLTSCCCTAAHLILLY